MKIKIKPEHKPYIIEIAIWIVLVVAALVLTLGLHYYFVVYKHTYNLKFTDIDGIIKGSPVRLMGVIIGHVRNVCLNNDDDVTVQIVVTKKDVKIPDGSRATVEFTGIIGSKSIEVMPPDVEPVEGEFNGIITRNPVRIKEFFKSFDIMNEALEALLMGADRLATEENLGLLKEFSQDPDFGPVDEILEGTEKIQKKSSEKLQGAIKVLDGWNKNLERLAK